MQRKVIFVKAEYMSLAGSLNPKVIRLVIFKKTVTVYYHLCELEISYYNVTTANGGNQLDPEAGIRLQWFPITTISIFSHLLKQAIILTGWLHDV